MPNGEGGSKCFNSNDSDFTNNTFDNGVPLNDLVSSITVYDQEICPSLVPNTPGNFRVSSTTQNSITLSSQDNSNNEAGFRIYRWNGSILEFVLWDTLGANITSYTDTRVVCGEGYGYQVAAFNDQGESNRPDWITGITDDCTQVPDAPSNLVGYAPSCGEIRLNWTDNSNNEDGFNIYRNGSYFGHVGANQTSRQDANVAGGTSFSYYVRPHIGDI